MRQPSTGRRLLDKAANATLILLIVVAVSTFLLLVLASTFHGGGPIGAAQSLEPDT
ncbi:hypothetical protein FHS85_002755 [Rhodoligotrophos appendicifer]|uniref:hypothetical protein n=1 Tax=Rhodoligotrophos appendicifer TaxID=987056 RepID=UPI0014792A91|nr:hypothetical protein [Rhodoligotrophos appendicifer]